MAVRNGNSIIFTELDHVEHEVIQDVLNYFEEWLPEYEVLGVFPSSDYRYDDYLYMVEAKRKVPSKYGMGNFACWTCWNEDTKSLSYGHYDIPSEEDCMEVFADFYRFAQPA